METFIQHPKYNKLIVGNYGTLISTYNWKQLKTYKTGGGYEEYKFRTGSRTDGTRKTINLKVHRLVGEMFVPNNDNSPCINHKDGNKNNNNYQNLEWVTVKENNIHAYRIGLKKGIPLSKEHKKILLNSRRKWWFDCGFKVRARNNYGQFI